MNYQKQLQRYRVALDNADFVTIERLWQEAVHNPGLAAKLLELEHTQQEEFNVNTVSPTIVQIHPKTKPSRWLLQVAVLALVVMTGILLANLRPDNDGVHIQTLGATNTPLPPNEREIITTRNIEQVVEVGQVGNGSVGGTLWLPDGKTFIAYGSLGLDFYQADQPTVLTRTIPTDYLIATATLSVDGKLIITGGNDGKVHGIDLATGEEVYEFQVNESVVWLLEVLPNGDIVTTGNRSDDADSVYVWDVAKQRERYALGYFNHTISDIAVSADGKLIAAAGFMSSTGIGTSVAPVVVLWDSSGQELTQVHGFTSPIEVLEFSPANDQLLMTNPFGNIHLLPITESYPLVSSPTKPNPSSDPMGDTLLIHYSADGQNLIAFKATTVVIYEGETLTTLEQIDYLSSDVFYAPRDFTIQPNGGDYLLVNDYQGSAIKVFSLNQKAYIATLPYSGVGQGVAVDSTTQYIARSTSRGVEVFSLDTLTPVAKLDKSLLGQYSYIQNFSTVSFVPNSTKLLVSVVQEMASNPILVTWDFKSNEFEEVDKDFITSYGVNPARSSIVYTTSTSKITVYNFLNQTSTEISQGIERPNYQPIRTLALHPNDSIIAYSTQRSYDVFIYDVQQAKVIATLSGSSRPLANLYFSPDGKWLASVDSGQHLILWDTVTWEEAGYIAQAGWVAQFNPESTLLATGGTLKNGIDVWDIEAGLTHKVNLQAHVSGIGELHFSSNSNLLVSASSDGTVRLWGVSE